MCDKKDSLFAADENLPAPIYGAPIITEEDGCPFDERFFVQENDESDGSSMPKCPDDESEEIFLAQENRMVCVYGPPAFPSGFGEEKNFMLETNNPGEVKTDEE